MFFRYIQAAASAKDVVILLDTSGSMKGLSLEIARETVKKLIETLNDDDYFNVIKVSKYFGPLRTLANFSTFEES